MQKKIDWTKEFGTGVKEIDAEHQEMIRILNKILDACRKYKKKKKLLILIDHLLELHKMALPF